MYMIANYWVRTFRHTSEWRRLLILSLISLVVFVLGIPLLFGILLLVFRKRVDDPSVRVWLGNFYFSYKPSFYWFEVRSRVCFHIPLIHQT